MNLSKNYLEKKHLCVSKIQGNKPRKVPLLLSKFINYKELHLATFSPIILITLYFFLLHLCGPLQKHVFALSGDSFFVCSFDPRDHQESRESSPKIPSVLHPLKRTVNSFWCWKWMVGVDSFPFEAIWACFAGAKWLLVSGRVYFFKLHTSCRYCIFLRWSKNRSLVLWPPLDEAKFREIRTCCNCLASWSKTNLPETNLQNPQRMTVFPMDFQWMPMCLFFFWHGSPVAKTRK